MSRLALRDWRPFLVTLVTLILQLASGQEQDRTWSLSVERIDRSQWCEVPKFYHSNLLSSSHSLWHPCPSLLLCPRQGCGMYDHSYTSALKMFDWLWIDTPPFPLTLKVFQASPEARMPPSVHILGVLAGNIQQSPHMAYRHSNVSFTHLSFFLSFFYSFFLSFFLPAVNPSGWRSKPIATL